MKKQIIAIVLGITTMVWSNSALSFYKEGEGMAQKGKPSVNSETKAANCSPATAQYIMEFNDVSCLIEQGGSMFQNRSTGTATYEVPKGGKVFAIFAGALWMGGQDVNGQLKLAALRYRSGNDFWPGPLSIDENSGNYDPSQVVSGDVIRDFGEATIDKEECQFYDKFYQISKATVIKYIKWWECQQGISTDCEDVAELTVEEWNAINTWPAHGHLDAHQDYYLAPFRDTDNNTLYEPENGDYPWYDDILDRDEVECGFDRRITLFGDNTLWWVFNDKGNIHTETNGDAIGMEIRAQAFSFATTDEVNRMTFYNYELINRGTQTLYNTFFSQYLDADIGNYADDYAGCDVSRGLGYMFNGDNNDESGAGKTGYGSNPPAIGCDFFEGPYMDSDGKDNVGPYYDSIAKVTVTPTVSAAIADNGIVYKGIGIGYSDGILDNERFGMRRFTYYTSTSAYPYTDPSNAPEYYNYMNGTWQNGSEMYYGGLGYSGSAGGTTILSDYMFPGDSDPLDFATAGVDPGFDWDESTNGNPSGDRRFVQSAGPFTLRPGAVNNITVGIVYGRGTDGDLFSSVRSMKNADTKAQALFDACFKILSPPDAPRLRIQELENQLVLTIDNPGTSNNENEAYEEEDEINITDPNVDRFYRFEGYQIFQMINEEASASDINDGTKARLVAQCDIENDIDKIINFELSESIGYDVPSVKVDGENKGIRHSFLITEDAFAQGDRALVNHKTYYFIAIAYAHNQFKEYDPNDPLLVDGQKIPYISSRLSYDGSAIKAVSAIPHNPIPEAGGTNQLVAYGTSPRITRVDGFGNGGRNLEYTQETIDNIVANGFMATPTYDYGAGPINVKVVDPLNVTGGHYVCKFRNYSTSVTNGADTAEWVIYRYDYEGGNIIDSVSSDLTIAGDNEQLIPEWGVSVQIHQNNYYLPPGGSGSTDARTTDFIDASMSFEDSSKRWLSFIPDNDAFFPTNWIRSGTYAPVDPDDCLPDAPAYLNPCNYPDEKGIDDSKEWAKVLEGGIAPHRLVGYQADFMPMAYYTYDPPASARKSASISFIPSVDIVITSDKSKWTRCPVIELGREASLNVGGAEPGQLRRTPSVDQDGVSLNDGTNGLGWFPGYAIDLETGARLYMAFGENSFITQENGADLIWNPSDNLFDNFGNPVMGGVQPFYVFSYMTKSMNNYPLGTDYPAYVPGEGSVTATNKAYNDLLNIDAGTATATEKREFFGAISWIGYPFRVPGMDHLSTDVTIRLRVNKEYKNFVATGKNSGMPMYSWSMDDIATQTGSADKLSEVLDMINVVPNPYYAYSEYERSRLESKVKIVNLPEKCTVRIYSVNGKLIRTFKKDSPQTYLDWDLNNHKGIPVASGVYLIHVDVPEIGEVVVKFFGGMRQIDLQGI